jgi:hypothetical protein
MAIIDKLSEVLHKIKVRLYSNMVSSDETSAGAGVRHRKRLF